MIRESSTTRRGRFAMGLAAVAVLAIAAGLAVGLRSVLAHGGEDHGGGAGGKAEMDLDAPRWLSEETKQAIGLTLVEAQVRPMEDTLTLTGVLRRKPDLHAKVGSRVTGRVSAVQVNPGDRVSGPAAGRPGQVLALIDSLEVSRLQADLVRASSEAATLRLFVQGTADYSSAVVLNQLVEWQVQFLNAGRDLEATRMVAESYRRIGEGVSKLDRLKAEQEEFRARTTLEGIRTRFAAVGFTAAMMDRLSVDNRTASIAEILHSAPEGVKGRVQSLGKLDLLMDRSQALALKEAEIARLRTELAALGFEEAEIADMATGKGGPRLLTVKSPIAGRISSRNVVIGQVVTADAVLFEVSDYSTLWVEAEVPEGMLARVMDRKTDRVRLRVAGRPGVSYPARIIFLSGEAEEKKRTAHLVADVDNSRGELLADMFAKATVVLSELPSVLSVPREALLNIGPETFVFAANGDAFEKRDVTPGVRDDRFVEVKSRKLFPGDRVVTQGAYQLLSVRTGKPVPPAAPASSKTGDGHDHVH